MRFNNILKYLSFGCVCLIIPVMAAATMLEKFYGAEFVREHLYTSMAMIILWGVISLSSIWYILRAKLYHKISTFSLHISLIVILIGAFTTHLTGHQGRIHLRLNDRPAMEYISSQGGICKLPFKVSLRQFSIDYYPGTFSPADFISTIIITDGEAEVAGSVSINNIYAYKNYRFYQSGYDADGKGSILSLSFDPYGIAITYTGYVWLLLSIIMFFFQKKTLFRDVARHLNARNGLMALCLIAGTFHSLSTPSSIPEKVADDFGRLYIYYNERIMPINTFATDFVKKIYGKESYKGLSSLQVMAGWFFFYDEWKNEPFIQIKGDDVKDALGLEGSYARLTDFIGNDGFKLATMLNEKGIDIKNAFTANEKFNLISTLVTGSALRIYPFMDKETGILKWYAITDKPDADIPADRCMFILNSMNLVAEKIALKDWEGVAGLLEKINRYQIKEGADLLPSRNKIDAEIFYNNCNYDKPLAIIFLTFGFILFIIFLSILTSGKIIAGRIIFCSRLLLAFLFLYLSFRLGIRGYISSHLPLSNGYETMQFMAWCAAVSTFIVSFSYRMILPFGFLVCGFTLLVAMMGESSLQITNLMPVLQSPLLSVHVMAIMLAYTLLFLIMLNGIMALLAGCRDNVSEKIDILQDVSRLMLYPAVFLLIIGIFIGAVWANISWGRYWGWDPKEVWALITFLIYSLPFHTNSLPWFRKPKIFHSYLVAAFLSVIITYFGVNFILGGMHSYA